MQQDQPTPPDEPYSRKKQYEKKNANAMYTIWQHKGVSNKIKAQI
jgi:hypothetical protein